MCLHKNSRKNIFGDEDALGKILKVDNNENYKVTGVLKDLPGNTEFNFEYLMSYESVNANIDSNWADVSIRTYVLLKPNTSLVSANAKIKDVITTHSGGKRSKNRPVSLSNE
ncbi:MAG: ABC transporter permease [Bacteroidota bacterium]